MDWLPTVLAAAFGAVIGSFLNVCIHRLPHHQSVVRPPSRCPKCGHQLAWYENVPVLSYAVQRGRCRACGSPISARYPIIETVTAAMFAAAFWYFGPTVIFAQRVLLGCILIVLFAIDLEHHLLPDAITLPGIAAGFAFSFFAPPGWLASLAGITFGYGILYAIAEAYFRVRHEEGLGGGDLKMLAMIGAFLGWKLTILTLIMASFAGSFAGILLIATRRGSMKYALPFGTFLAIGAAVSATVGTGFVDWYLGML
jgi:leader peptidase (prepilin peptidase) / N-methyltransferase